MPIPSHLTESDYSKTFPTALDEFPTVIDEQHYIDAWLLNSVFDSLLITEQYLLDHKANIESPLGADVIGDGGQLEMSIPAARYSGYETALAWDSELLEENIKDGVSIFGVTGSYVVTGGALGVSLPVLDAGGSWLFPSIPNQSLTASVVAASVPNVSAS